jgi:polyhydroxybutyrate depolymerase
VHSTGVLTILGTDDITSPYNGIIYQGVEYYLSAAATHSYWASHNNCDTTASLNIVSPSVERYSWSTASGCTYVEELKVIGGGHDWPGSFGNMTIDANIEIWQFVSRYDINGLISCLTTSINENNRQNDNKQLIKIVDILGKETKSNNNTPLFYIYDDGTVKKKIILK